MKTITTIIRILLGVLIIISGINKFGHWLNTAIMQDAMEWVINLSNIGGSFIINSLAVIEILIGLAFIFNKYVTLAALTLLPIIVSIITFHIILKLNGVSIALFVLAMNVFILYLNRSRLLKVLHDVE